MHRPEYILGVDYGHKRVGLALAHRVARLPRPLRTVPNDAELLTTLRNVVNDEDVARVVVGLPRTLTGEYSQQTRDAEAFAAQLRMVLTVPVETADETLTSVDAEAVLGSQRHAKGAVDALAASLILERYLAGLGPETDL